MAQNLTIEDVAREVQAIYSTYGEMGGVMFCEAKRGMTCCDRFAGHNGKHAAITSPAFDNTKGAWYFTRIVRF
jgi:hypothetical protein